MDHAFEKKIVRRMFFFVQVSLHNGVWYCANKLSYAFIFVEIRERVRFLNTLQAGK